MKRDDVVVQENEAAALADDAVADTLTRVRVWHPERVKLTTHLCGVIRSRTNARMARVRKIRHESIHEADDDEAGEAEIAVSLGWRMAPSVPIGRGVRRARAASSTAMVPIQHDLPRDVVVARIAALSDRFGPVNVTGHRKYEAMSDGDLRSLLADIEEPIAGEA